MIRLPAVLLVAALTSGAAAQEAVLNLGDAFTGAIDSVFDADTVQFQGVAGTLLTATATGKQGFHPTLSLQDVSTGQEVDVTAFLKTGGTKASLKKLPLPSTGDYLLTVGPLDTTSGEYKLTTKGKVGKTLKSFKDDGTSSEPGSGQIEFAALPGTKLTATVKPAKGVTATPDVPLLDGPEGPVDIAGNTELIDGKVPKAKVTDALLLLLGDYVFTPTEQPAGEGDAPPLTTTLKLTFPKVAKVTLAEQPTFANANTLLASQNTAGQQGFSDSLEAALSFNGHVICFKSHATNLVAGAGGDTIGENSDIFVRDLDAGTTVVASAPSDSDDGTGACESPTLDGSGGIAVFASLSSGLVAGDGNGTKDIFVREVGTRQTTRVSVADGGVEAHGDSIDPDVSADGRYVVFASLAADLVADDANGTQDVFLHDRVANTTVRVSVSASGAEAHGVSSDPVISGDGQRVAFTSTAADLLPPGSDTNGKADVYVKILSTGEVLRASLNGSGQQITNVDANQPSLSSNGRFVAFVSSGFFAPTAINGSTDVFVKDLQTGTVDHVSLDPGGVEGNGHSVLPQLSASGQLVLFRTQATNLVAGDNNGGIGDVLLRDRPSKVTMRVSVNNFGDQANNECVSGDLSGDGSAAAFYGFATNLNPAADINGTAFDVWIRN